MKNVINTAVIETLSNYRQRHLLVGFSGGADSTALLLAARHAASELGRDLTAVHFEHGIRGKASLADAAWCRKFCSEREIEFRMIKLHIPKHCRNGENLEETARRQRLLHWRKMTRSLPDSVVLLGHHGDDRVENLLLRLCRGSNASGLTGMRTLAKLDGVVFLRPLLPFSKAEIIAHLELLGLASRLDHTNHDNSLSRNFIRNRILPEIYDAIPPARAGMIHAANAIEDDACLLEELASARYRRIRNMEQSPVSFWRKLPPALLVRVLRLWLTDAANTEFIPNHSLVKRFAAELRSCKHPKAVLPVDGKLQIMMRDGICRVCVVNNDKPARIEPVSWHWQEQPSIRFKKMVFSAAIINEKPKHFNLSPDRAWFDAEVLPEHLWLTAKQPGDRMIRFGSKSPVKVKKIIIDAKLDSTQKSCMPVVRTASGEIIWLPGIKHSAFAPVTDRTVKVALLTVADAAASERDRRSGNASPVVSSP